MTFSPLQLHTTACIQKSVNDYGFCFSAICRQLFKSWQQYVTDLQPQCTGHQNLKFLVATENTICVCFDERFKQWGNRREIANLIVSGKIQNKSGLQGLQLFRWISPIIKMLRNPKEHQHHFNTLFSRYIWANSLRRSWVMTSSRIPVWYQIEVSVKSSTIAVLPNWDWSKSRRHLL